MRVTGWTAATLRAQPARVIRAHFARIFAGLVWSPELAQAARTPMAPRGAFADIAALWIAIVTTLVLFWRVSTAAGVLFLPYLAWVSFAAVLNFTLWRMNTP